MKRFNRFLIITMLSVVFMGQALAGALTDYAENKIIDFQYRGQTLTAPAHYFGLIVANKGYWVASTAYALNDYVLPATPNGHLYKATTAGTSAASAPAFPTTAGATVADGTVVWTEQTTALEAGTFPEVSGGSYARVSVTGSLANFAGTQGAGTTLASTGTSGTTSNNIAITFPAPTANWGVIFGWVDVDALTAGNAWVYTALTTPKTVNSGDAAPSFSAGALTFQIDN